MLLIKRVQFLCTLMIVSSCASCASLQNELGQSTPRSCEGRTLKSISKEIFGRTIIVTLCHSKTTGYYIISYESGKDGEPVDLNGPQLSTDGNPPSDIAF
jgi:hypothetical protein